jgi:hypothetical protein
MRGVGAGYSGIRIAAAAALEAEGLRISGSVKSGAHTLIRYRRPALCCAGRKASYTNHPGKD